MIVTNKDGIQTSIVRELQDGKVEVAFSTCNRTKVYTKQAFLSGNTSDYFRTPSGVDSVQYHTGERRRQSNGNIAIIIGGTKRGLVAKDEITGAQAECSYKAFYDGNAFGTGVLLTPEQCIRKSAKEAKEAKKRKEEEHKKFIEQTIYKEGLMKFKSKQILSVGNEIHGYMPCIQNNNGIFSCYSKSKQCFISLSEDDLKQEIYSGRFSDYSMDFLVGKVIKLKPFGLNAKIIKIGNVTYFSKLLGHYEWQLPSFILQLEDGTLLRTHEISSPVDFNYNIPLFSGILTNMPEKIKSCRGSFHNQKVNGKFEKVYCSSSYATKREESVSITDLIIYGISLVNGTVMIDFEYTKVKRAIVEKVKNGRDLSYTTFTRDTDNPIRVKIPLRDFNNYVIEHEFDMSKTTRAQLVWEKQNNGK